MKKVAKKSTAQPALFPASVQYGWKSVQQVTPQDRMVVFQQEVKILGVRQENDTWWVSYVDPDTGKKTEQLYNVHDSIYTRLQEKQNALGS